MYSGLADPTRERASWMDDKTAELYASEVLDVYNTCDDIPQLSLENPRTQVCFLIFSDFPASKLLPDRPTVAGAN